MNAPKPKKEIAIIRITHFDAVCHMIIWTLTPDAREWLLQNGPCYGDLSGYEDTDRRFSLMVIKDIFDPDEVARYIESMGNG
jgi:hypothetical protein